MATLTIRNLDDALKERLRALAASHGRSMEEEAREILRRAIYGVTGPTLWETSRKLFSGDKGVQLDTGSRSDDRSAPSFD